MSNYYALKGKYKQTVKTFSGSKRISIHNHQLVWKLDREIWALVEKGEATVSWARQESAKLIQAYSDQQNKGLREDCDQLLNVLEIKHIESKAEIQRLTKEVGRLTKEVEDAIVIARTNERLRELLGMAYKENKLSIELQSKISEIIENGEAVDLTPKP